MFEKHLWLSGYIFDTFSHPFRKYVVHTRSFTHPRFYSISCVNLGPAAVSPPPVATAGVIGLETKDALYTAHRSRQNRQSGVVVDMGKVVGVLRGHVPHRGGGGGGGGAHGLGLVGDDEGEEEEGGEEHLGCNLSLMSCSFSKEVFSRYVFRYGQKICQGCVIPAP